MKYSLLIALILTLIQKKNPLTFIKNIEFQWPLVILISFGVQIALAFATIQSKEKFELILILTFVGITIGLWKNRHIAGVKWILAGALLNFAALLLHGGLMPVSESALLQTGQEVDSFDTDSRHQLMDSSSPYWILGDWIPVIRYVLSPGDLLVGIGIILLIMNNSSKWELKVKVK
ncbi:DUF5317 family protein [Bacillus benzoevorans]|uniref:Putative membrane protein n=1 Tax=Bacillus benzoevorans TaxID=1456 RepID=A0A7X0HSN4_9BACI|nr:DUF5317 family protein [Bacillus benzoevorans]MBB6446139.1 putative membrane protein [Bacillus benzoevorans]